MVLSDGGVWAHLIAGHLMGHRGAIIEPFLVLQVVEWYIIDVTAVLKP